MLDKTLQKIELIFQSSPELTESKKQELMHLLTELKQELSGLSQAEQDKVLGAVKINKIEEFELSHPRLYELAKDLVLGLNGLGV